MVYFLISLSAIFAALGHTFLKLGASNHTNILSFINIYIFLGLLLYFISMILWIYSLSKVQLSVAFAFTMLTFILVYLFSWLFLGEPISKMAILGILFIGIGILLISLGQSIYST